MMLIVEGLDKCGKSTLVDYLLKNLEDTFIIKNGYRPKGNDRKEKEKILYIYDKLLSNYIQNFQNDILIFDRYFISELVYCKKRGYDAFKIPGMKDFISAIEERKDIILIYCRTDYNNIKKKFIEDKEEYIEIDEIRKLDKRYQEVISKINMLKLPYDYTVTSPKTVVEKIKEIKGDNLCLLRQKEKSII